MSAAADVFRKLWEKFGPSMTSSSIHVEGVSRPMTDEERKHFDAAFLDADRAFAHMDRAFDAARRENRRRKP